MDLNFKNLNDLHQTISSAFYGALTTTIPTEWQLIAQRIPSSSARNTYPFLKDIGPMREWLGPRIAEQLESVRYSIENRHFEKTLEGDMNEIADDEGGMAPLYAERARLLANTVARHVDELVLGEGLAYADGSTLPQGGVLDPAYDGQDFFDTAHPVGATTVSNKLALTHGTPGGDAWYLFDTTKPLKPLIYQERQAPRFVAKTDLASENVFNNRTLVWGADRRDAVGFGLWQTALRVTGTLDYENFVAARTAMQKFTNDNGINMRMNPNTIWVPRGQRQNEAELLFKRQLIDSGSTNVLYNVIDVHVSNYLPFA